MKTDIDSFLRTERLRNQIVAVAREVAIVFAIVALVAAVLLVATGCSSPVPLDASRVGPVGVDIAKRHDKYVLADTSLTETERQDYLRDSEIFRKIIAEALAQGAAKEVKRAGN